VQAFGDGGLVAAVSLIPVDVPGEFATARTDPNGAYALNEVLPGTYNLKFEGSGFATTYLRGVEIHGGDSLTLPTVALEISMFCSWPYRPEWLQLGKPDQTESGELSGTVLGKRRKPVANVEVILRNETRTLSMITGTDGRFRFSDLAPGSYDVSLHRKSYFDEARKDVHIQGGFVGVFRPIVLERCSLAGRDPALRRRKVIRCE